ncbi:hypothetical protein ACFQ71_37795 [Streptomyces sp. NPDC056534]|uniref:hypothetical protein n=1 Tax=Streptomyces sp. NPDC056534 TaxID=3345857 RepID=UPI0036C39083
MMPLASKLAVLAGVAAVVVSTMGISAVQAEAPDHSNNFLPTITVTPEIRSADSPAWRAN